MKNNFIFQDYIKDISLCDDIIDFFENNPLKSPGSVGMGVNDEYKKSTDCMLQGPLMKKYNDELQKIVNKYIEEFPFCNANNPWRIIQNINIQRYLEGEGFYAWHCERSNPHAPLSSRHLVFMTYLNDVEDGGTEFYHQGLKTEAKKGLTLIWPADWTHTHRGIVSNTKTKYIVTGWFNYVPWSTDATI